MSLLIESPGRSQVSRFGRTAGSALALAKHLFVGILRSMGESELAPSCAPNCLPSHLVQAPRRRVMVEA